jgi:hypothetical protein
MVALDSDITSPANFHEQVKRGRQIQAIPPAGRGAREA